MLILIKSQPLLPLKIPFLSNFIQQRKKKTKQKSQSSVITFLPTINQTPATMAALQQSPVAFQAKSPPSTRISAKIPTPKSIRLSFSSSLPSLKLLKSTAKLTGKSRRNHRGASVIKALDTAASRYAGALAEVANSAGTLDATITDLEKLEKVFADPEVYKFFINPTLVVEEKFKLIDEMDSSLGLQPTTKNFLYMLIDVNRIDLINDMIRDFEIVYNNLTETELAVVTSVVKLESQHLAQIAKEVQALTGAKNVRIKTLLDPSLVAGFTVRYGNAGSKLIDMSVRKQLQELASQIDVSDIELATAV